MHRIRKSLHDQESYSLHKPVRRRFQRNHIVSADKNNLWMADLIDKICRWEQGIEVHSSSDRYLLQICLKHKTREEVANAFKEIFTTSQRSPAKLITDKGICIYI